MNNKEIKTRTTRQKNLILEELRALDSHPTADEIYAIVKQKLPNISLGTVYRNLENLSKSGEIIKLEIAGTQKRFDGNPKKHYHIRCVECGSVGDLHGVSVENLENLVQQNSNYEILGHRLEFSGVCPNCKNKLNNK